MDAGDISNDANSNNNPVERSAPAAATAATTSTETRNSSSDGQNIDSNVSLIAKVLLKNMLIVKRPLLEQ